MSACMQAETTAQAGTPAETETPEEDTIVIMAPPVTGNYVNNLKNFPIDSRSYLNSTNNPNKY